MWETWFRSLGWEDPLEKEGLSTPVFWSGEFHGLYSPCFFKKLILSLGFPICWHITISKSFVNLCISLISVITSPLSFLILFIWVLTIPSARHAFPPQSFISLPLLHEVIVQMSPCFQVLPKYPWKTECTIHSFLWICFTFLETTCPHLKYYMIFICLYIFLSLNYRNFCSSSP